MIQPIRFPFTSVNPEMGEAGFRPFLPIALTNGDRAVMAEGLLDTGAMVNVSTYTEIFIHFLIIKLRFDKGFRRCRCIVYFTHVLIAI
jgi:hypothetical protein